MRRNRTLAILLLALTGATAVAVSGSAAGRERTIVLDIRHSRFSHERISVRRGETVRFVVRNADPIDHELIVGPMDVQRRHESGREKHHPPVPGEVSVPLFETAATSYTFADPGTVWFGCHLPGHWSYGMRGRITVV